MVSLQSFVDKMIEAHMSGLQAPVEVCCNHVLYFDISKENSLSMSLHPNGYSLIRCPCTCLCVFDTLGFRVSSLNFGVLSSSELGFVRDIVISRNQPSL